MGDKYISVFRKAFLPETSAYCMHTARTYLVLESPISILKLCYSVFKDNAAYLMVPAISSARWLLRALPPTCPLRLTKRFLALVSLPRALKRCCTLSYMARFRVVTDSALILPHSLFPTLQLQTYFLKRRVSHWASSGILPSGEGDSIQGAIPPDINLLLDSTLAQYAYTYHSFYLNKYHDAPRALNTARSTVLFFSDWTLSEKIIS